MRRLVAKHVQNAARSSSTAAPQSSAQTPDIQVGKDEGATSIQEQPEAAATESPRKKTVAELDEELRAKLEGRSGEGGAAGLELEGGKPVAMKRGVKENMFRVI